MRVGCEFSYDVTAPTAVTVQVRPRSDSSHQLVSETWSTTPQVPIDEYSDIYGNPVKRFVMPSGLFLMSYDAISAVPDEAEGMRRKRRKWIVGRRRHDRARARPQGYR